MPSTPQLTFAQLMEIRGAAEKMLGNKTSLPPIHKDLMQYWTTAEAKAFYESGGLSFPSSYSPTKYEPPPSYNMVASHATPAPAAPAPAPAAAAAALELRDGEW